MACLLSAGETRAATLQAVSGNVEIVRAGVVLPATTATQLQEGDELQSGAGKAGFGEALIRFDDGAMLALRNGSTLLIRELPPQGIASAMRSTVRLTKGSLRYKSAKTRRRHMVIFETNTATVGIRGTDIEILVSDVPAFDNNPGTYLKVNSGSAVLTAIDGAQVEVNPGEAAYGGEPDLAERGHGNMRRAAARKVPTTAASLFKSSGFDELMN